MIARQDDDAPDQPGEGEGLHARAWSLIHDDGGEAALEEATRLLAEHLSEHPPDAGSFTLLSVSLLALGRPDESLEAALEAVRLSGDSAEPYFRAGLALFELAALADDASHDEEAADLGDSGDGEGADLAPRDLRASLPASLSGSGCAPVEEAAGGPFLSPTIHFVEATLDIPALRDATLASESLEMFEHAIACGAAPGAPELWAGLCLLNLGRPAMALDCFQDASEAEGELETIADAWFLRGITLEELDRDREASEAYRVALAHFPDHRAARIRLDWLDPDTRDRFLEAADVADLCRYVEKALEAGLEPASGAAAEAERDLSAACSGALEHARRWAEGRQVAPDRLESFLVYHGAVCDCEVLLNLERRLGLE